MSEAPYERRPLGDAVERHIGGGTPPRQVPSYWKGEIPWASVKDFPEQKSVIQDTEEHISFTGLHASASNLIPGQTPLVCTRMAVGRAAMSVLPMAINQDVKALFPASGVSAEYLLKLMQYIQPLAEGRAVGSTVKGIRIQDYLNIPVPLAPQEAQPVIAQILETLDTAIRETETLNGKLKAVKHGLLHDLLTRGIDASGQLRPPQNEAPQLYKESHLGWIPKDWGVDFGKNVCRSIVVGIVIKPTQYYRESGVAVLRSANVRETGLSLDNLVYMSPKDHQNLSKSAVGKGDVLTVRTGYPGTSCVVDNQIEDANCVDIIISRPRPELDPTYWSTWINSDFGKKQVLAVQGGLAQQHFNVGDLMRLVVKMPPITEQEAISDRLRGVISRIDAEAREQSKLFALKVALLDDLLTGCVRVTPLLESMRQSAAPTGA